MASSNLAIRFAAETLRSLAFGSISGTYAAVGSALINPARQFMIVNNTNILLTFSFDGTNDHFVLLPGTSFIDDVMTNKASTGGSWALPHGAILYVKGEPASGSVYFSVFYGAGVTI